MNTYCSGRSSRPADLFAYGLLGGRQKSRYPDPAGTNSPARTELALFIHRAVRLRDAHRKGRILVRLGWAGVIESFGLSRVATALNNPG